MSAVFVLPVIESGRGAPVASLLSTAGWATGGARRYGRSWIVTPYGIIDPARARELAVRDQPPPAPASDSPAPAPPRSLEDRLRSALPEQVKTLYKDARQAVWGRQFNIGEGPWDDGTVEWVWQRHELFQTAGLDLADRLGVPSVLFVPATKVWESNRWGTTRPGWASTTERLGEAPSLRKAALVACGSASVAEQAMRLGTPAERILITPTGVNVDRFAESDRAAGRRLVGLDPDDDRLVVGWMGSFRPFHDLDLLVEAVRDVEHSQLLFVGDGPERGDIERQCEELGVTATFTGTVDQGHLPDVLAAMDIAVVVTGAADTFHYSPLKLGEYLAAGLPVIAPDVASIRDRVTNEINAVLVPAADRGALRDAIREFRDDDDRRARFGAAATELARHSFTWVEQLRRIDGHLGIALPEPSADAPTIVPPSRD